MPWRMLDHSTYQHHGVEEKGCQAGETMRLGEGDVATGVHKAWDSFITGWLLSSSCSHQRSYVGTCHSTPIPRRASAIRDKSCEPSRRSQSTATLCEQQSPVAAVPNMTAALRVTAAVRMTAVLRMMTLLRITGIMMK